MTNKKPASWRDFWDDLIFPSKESDGIEHVDCSYDEFFVFVEQERIKAQIEVLEDVLFNIDDENIAADTFEQLEDLKKQLKDGK